MSTISEHFGDGVATTIFSPERKSHMGKLRCCIGKDNMDSSIKWYGYINKSGRRINPNSISFCEFCGENYFKESERFLITESEYPNMTKNLVCDAPYTDKCLEYGINKRCIQFRGLRFNINLVHPTDDDIWRPTMKIPTEVGMRASQNGVGIFPVPTGSYWEFVIRGDPNGLYSGSDYYFKIKKAVFGDGRSVTVTDQHGNSNIVIPTNWGQLIINSYKTGVEGQRFCYMAPSDLEKDHYLEATHNNESNKLLITVSIHKKIMLDPEPIYRGGSGVTRGGSGVTRGGSGVTKGGSYTGGSNFASTGYSSNIQTRKVNATFPEIDRVDIIVQLVNNESEEERLYTTRLIQEQVDIEKERKIERMRSEIDRLSQQDIRSAIIGHNEQQSLLI